MLLDTPLCDFGWQAPTFTLKDTEGNTHTLDSAMGPKGLLIIFMCNHCPYVKAIIDRLVIDTTLLLTEGVNVVGIMSNDYHEYPEDHPENMKKFKEQHALPFPYLIDEDQQVGKSYGAVCTPDFFGFNARGELNYRGRLDDAKMEDKDNRVPELLNAMRMIAATGKGPKEQTASMGCSIKWKSP